MINELISRRITGAWMPHLGPIVYYSRLNCNGEVQDCYNPYQVPQARRRKINKKDSPFGVFLLLKIESTFELYRNVLEASLCPLPKKDDFFLDQETGLWWQVLAVDISAHNQVYNLGCVKYLTPPNVCPQ